MEKYDLRLDFNQKEYMTLDKQLVLPIPDGFYCDREEISEDENVLRLISDEETYSSVTLSVSNVKKLGKKFNQNNIKTYEERFFNSSDDVIRIVNRDQICCLMQLSYNSSDKDENKLSCIELNGVVIVKKAYYNIILSVDYEGLDVSIEPFPDDIMHRYLCLADTYLKKIHSVDEEEQFIVNRANNNKEVTLEESSVTEKKNKLRDIKKSTMLIALLCLVIVCSASIATIKHFSSNKNANGEHASIEGSGIAASSGVAQKINGKTTNKYEDLDSTRTIVKGKPTTGKSTTSKYTAGKSTADKTTQDDSPVALEDTKYKPYLGKWYLEGYNNVYIEISAIPSNGRTLVLTACYFFNPTTGKIFQNDIPNPYNGGIRVDSTQWEYYTTRDYNFTYNTNNITCLGKYKFVRTQGSKSNATTVHYDGYTGERIVVTGVVVSDDGRFNLKPNKPLYLKVNDSSDGRIDLCLNMLYFAPIDNPKLDLSPYVGKTVKVSTIIRNSTPTESYVV